ncbi:hypothetical protein HYH03_003685 [Edaphochlamys debaryana]|uniref:Uncharacterized protein n=1 Tax=Edaphochlamys debaryana TaxID=47281 RepID=A0A835YBG6_9CHLO|nr:hypothetical protein HYH03_003685 [Edaphochlamys debaryana]|eukprot:KAG2498427.1 hypothetical protein HYH03_003685 [Edaphochlamys debaryana]
MLDPLPECAKEYKHVVPSGVVPVTTEAELVAAVTNNSVPGAHLTNNLKLTANGWPATAISRTSNFTVFGGELFPILDLSFIEGKIQLAPGVLFAFRQVELRNVRQRSGFEVDIFAASPNATVRFDGTVHFAFSCLPMDSLMAYMMGTPPASLPQDIRLSTWCRPQPALARCYGNASTLLLRSGSGLLEVVGFTGVTSGGGYVLEAYRDAYFVCENPVTEEECSAGYNNCVESKIARLYGNDTTWQRLAQWDQAHTQESPSSPSTTTAAAPSPQPAGDDSSNSSTVAAAVGGAVGGAVGLALVAALALFLWRRRSAPRSKQGGGSEDGGGKPGEVCILVAPAAGPGATSAANGNGAGPTANGNNAVSLGTTQTEADSSTGNEATGAMSMSLVNLNASTVAHTPAANGSPYAAGGAAAGCPVVLKPPLGAAVAARAMLLPHEAGRRVPALTVANSNRSSAASVVQVAGIYVELGAQLGAGSFGKVFRGAAVRRRAVPRRTE